MDNVHPDHAALIAELYDRAPCADGTDKLLMVRAADALASAPSPRTPLPQLREAILKLKTGKWAPPCVLLSDVLSVVDAALAAAPKVERRAPTDEQIVNAFIRLLTLWYGAKKSGPLVVTELRALFTSPEAPERDDGCGSPHSKGGKCAYDD